MISVQADCTPSSVRWTQHYELHERHASLTGRHSAEFLMARATIYGWDARGVMSVKPVVRDSQDMVSTSAWQYFLHVRALFPKLKKLRGRRQLCVRHDAYDRAGFSAITRYVEQDAEQFVATWFPEKERELEDLTDLNVSTGCCLHDIAGGIRWASKAYLPKEKEEARGFLKDLHVGIASLRNSVAALVLNVASHVESIEWADREGSFGDALALWMALEFKPEVAEDLARLDPRVVNGRLRCNRECKLWPNAAGRIAALFQEVWHHRDFCETRFGTLGPSLRKLVATSLIGTDIYVRRLCATPGIRTYRLNGWKKLRPSHWRYAVTLCLSAKVGEALSIRCMKDDRLARRPKFYQAIMPLEMSALAAVPKYVFQRLAALCGDEAYTGAQCQSEVIHAGLVQVAYVDRAVFVELRQPPWSLCDGDAEAKLVALGEAGPQTHPAARKLQRLVRDKWPMPELKQVVGLLELVKWSTLQVEQMHGSLSVMHRYHPQYTIEKLVLRAFLHFAAVWTTQPKLDWRLRRDDKTIAALEKKKPQCKSGTSQFVQVLQGAGHAIAPQTRDPFKQGAEVVKFAAQTYRSLPQATRHAFFAQAVVSRGESKRALQERLAELKARRKASAEEIEQSKQDKRAAGNFNAGADDVRLGQEEVAALQTKYTSSAYAPAALPALRAAAERPPDTVREEDIHDMLRRPYYQRPWQRFTHPWWLSHVCHLRDYFVNTAIRFGPRDTDPWFVFVYALQNPLQASFLAVVLMDITPMPEEWGFEETISFGHLFHLYEFGTANMADVRHEYMMLSLNSADMYVATGLLNVGEGYYGTRNPLLPFTSFIAQFGDDRPRAPRPEGEVHGLDAPRVADEEMHPWLRQRQLRLAGIQQRPPKRPRLAPAAEERPPLDEDELREVYAEVERMRLDWQASHGEVERMLLYFRLVHRGGGWTARNKGKPIDSCRGEPVGDAGRRMLVDWGLAESFGASFLEYDQQPAEMICFGWCHKMAYYCELWVQSGFDPKFCFTPEHHRTYVEYDELAELAHGWAPGTAQHRRLQDLHRFQPDGLRLLAR